MIPWVTAALSLEEQSNMFDTWLLATRNTMFDQWLHARFPSSPITSPRFLTPVLEHSQTFLSQQDDMPQSGDSDKLRMLADYLAKDSSSGVSDENVEENVECMIGTEGSSCVIHFEGGKNLKTTATCDLSDFSACQQADCMDQNYSCSPGKQVFQS
ncbi:hypothetical protein L7F22_063396 [Adiantum nelumboides]|nr:hypothetical protein [Adiantum nelumboides]